jgi:hypothetical protein
MANKLFTETVDDPQPGNGGSGTATAIAAGEVLVLERDPVTGRVKATYSYAEAGKTNVVTQTFVVGAGSQPETRALALISSARVQVFGP